MVEAPSVPRAVRFGPFEADLATGELRRDGERVPLQDKPFQMLALLLGRPGGLVTREELRTQLWPADTFVDFEHGLNTAVKKLRQALDDSADTPRFVETLPRRGYRFVGTLVEEPAVAAPVAADPPAPTAAPPEPAPAPVPVRRSWPLHAAWAGAVVLAALLPWPHRRMTAVDHAPPRNARPVIVLMDSPLPGRVYDPRTFAAGGTNADDITDALQQLPATIQKETTSAMWHREEQVVRQNPDLIVSHLSCLLDARLSEPGQEGPVSEHLFTLARNRLIAVYGYVAAANLRTRFLVYSRGAFATADETAVFVGGAETRFPALRGRLYTVNVPGDPEKATFRDPATARLVRDRVKAILDLQ